MNLQEKYNEYKQRQEAKKFFNMKTLLFLQLIPIIMSWIHGHHLQA